MRIDGIVMFVGSIRPRPCWLVGLAAGRGAGVGGYVGLPGLGSFCALRPMGFGLRGILRRRRRLAPSGPATVCASAMPGYGVSGAAAAVAAFAVGVPFEHIAAASVGKGMRLLGRGFVPAAAGIAHLPEVYAHHVVGAFQGKVALRADGGFWRLVEWVRHTRGGRAFSSASRSGIFVSFVVMRIRGCSVPAGRPLMRPADAPGERCPGRIASLGVFRVMNNGTPSGIRTRVGPGRSRMLCPLSYRGLRRELRLGVAAVWRMEPPAGIEPADFRVEAGCSVR